MRELWTKVPQPAVLVLDNYHELSECATLHSLLPIALAEFPSDNTLIVISRQDPPASWARDLTHHRVGKIGWNDLRLTFEETHAIAASMSNLDLNTLQSLHARSNGWVAGTILMLERCRANKVWDIPQSDSMADIFHYFANQVFEHMDFPMREVLIRTALLPWMTGAMAEEVSGRAGAGQVIRDLYQRGLFVDRRAETRVAYQYHDLFRDFLLAQCHVQMDEVELHGAKRTAARVTAQAGLQDTAVLLYAETQSWNELSELISESAEQLLTQGRYQTLQGYIALLPEVERSARPWLLFWSGMSRLVFDPTTARADLEAAYYQFDSDGQDISGLFLACSGIIEAYHCNQDDMAPAIPWGDRLYQLLKQHNGFPSPAVEAKVLTNLQGLMYACPHHPLLLELEQSIDRILHSLQDPAGCLGVAAAFTNLPLWRGDFPRVRQILDRLTPHIQGPLLPPLPLLIWKVTEANYYWNIRDQDRAKEKLNEASNIAQEFGIHVFKPMIVGIQTYNALATGDVQEAERLEKLLCAMKLNQRLAMGQINFYRAGIGYIRGNFQSARTYASMALELTAPLCLPFMTGNCRVGFAKLLIELGETDLAQQQLETTLDYARIMRSRSTEVQCHLTRALLLLKEGRLEDSNNSLREGLRIASRNDYLTLDYWWQPKMMSALLAQALEAGIEVDYVRSVIRRRGLRAPSSALDKWPYRIEIITLGRFEVAIDSVPLTYVGKAQRKPLEFLKYLCGAGAQPIHQDLIQEILWPEADGDAAEQAFRTTLHRLRRLLQHDEVVNHSDRQVWLDLSLMAIDHVRFEEMARQLDPTDALAGERVLALYHGHFLQGETAPWILPTRERLRATFLNLTEQLGNLLETRGEVVEAAQKYLNALEVEPVAEVMVQRVMTTYARLGRRSEALGVYQRFTHALHRKLGIPPTSKTVALYQKITELFPS